MGRVEANGSTLTSGQGRRLLWNQSYGAALVLALVLVLVTFLVLSSDSLFPFPIPHSRRSLTTASRARNLPPCTGRLVLQL